MRTIALYENRDKPNAKEYATAAAKILNSMGTKLIAGPDFVESLTDTEREWVEAVPYDSFGDRADSVISFGGDGTMLKLAKSMVNTGVPIMGVNVGRLGFLAEYRVGELETAMRAITTGNYRIVERFMISATLEGENTLALNDIVLERKLSSRMITVEAYANNSHIADYRADGLIVTTPTGSTAYSLSCGGPIIAPTCQVMCITPISPHSLNLRPLVVSDDNEIRLIPHSHDVSAQLVIDGQNQITVENGQAVVIRKSSSSVKMIKPVEGSYFSLLKDKLHWASSPIERKDSEDRL